MKSTVSVALLNRMRGRAGLDPMADDVLLEAVQVLASLDEGIASRRDQPAVIRSAGATRSSRA